jgi:hypothetical protein
MDVSATGTGKGRTADAVRARSRDVYEALLDRIQERVDSPDSFTLSELAQAANVTGRIGLGGDEQRDGMVIIRIVRDALPEPLYNEGALSVDNPPKLISPISLGYAERVEAMAHEPSERRATPRLSDDGATG